MNQYFEEIPCPCCGARGFRDYIKVRYGALKQRSSLDYSGLGITPDTVLTVKECLSCRLVFLNPRMGIQAEDWIYNESKQRQYANKPFLIDQQDDRNRVESIKRKTEYARELLEILSYFKFDRRLTLFDYGCGFGHTMQLAESVGLDVYGVDIDQRRLNYCKRLGLKVSHQKDFLTEHPEVKADIIFWQSNIEHIVDLNATMRLLTKVCAPGGRVWVNGLTPKVINKERKTGMFVKAHFIEHINYFPVKTLDRFFRKYGFAPEPKHRAYLVDGVQSLARAAVGYLAGAYVDTGSFKRVYRLAGG